MVGEWKCEFYKGHLDFIWNDLASCLGLGLPPTVLKKKQEAIVFHSDQIVTESCQAERHSVLLTHLCLAARTKPGPWKLFSPNWVSDGEKNTWNRDEQPRRTDWARRRRIPVNSSFHPQVRTWDYLGYPSTSLAFSPNVTNDLSITQAALEYRLHTNL